MDTWWAVLLLLGLMVLLNAAFSGSEIALISVRGSQLRRLERTGGPRGRAVVRLVREPNRFLATIQLGITAIGFLASATAALTLSEPLVDVLEPLGGAAQPVAVALVTGGLTFVTLVVGELTPKRLALQAPLRWALLVAAPLDALARVSRPVVWALGAATDGLVRILLGRTPASAPDLSPEELRDLVAGHRGLTPQQRTIIVGALELDQRTLRQVLVPRREVFTVPVDWAPAQARTRLALSGHSRAPLVGPDGLDDVRGLVNLRDLEIAEGTLLDAATEPLIWPDSLRVADALREFRATRQQFALVTDEFGAVIGIVTLEDLLEEVVGEIYDETDRDVVEVQRQADGSLILPGTFPIHDLPDLGLEIPRVSHRRYTTVAGLVLASLQRVPDRPGDRITLGGWTFEVVDVHRHAITSVRVWAPREQAGRDPCAEPPPGAARPADGDQAR